MKVKVCGQQRPVRSVSRSTAHMTRARGVTKRRRAKKSKLELSIEAEKRLVEDLERTEARTRGVTLEEYREQFRIWDDEEEERKRAGETDTFVTRGPNSDSYSERGMFITK